MVALDQYTIRDTFTDSDSTTLASHDSDVNFSGNPWKKQFSAGGTLEIQSNQVKLPALVFGLPYTLYTKDAGSENYIVRLRMAGARVEPVYFWFRVAADNKAYCIQANHDGASSYLRLMYFDGTNLTQLTEVNPGSLTDGGFHWYQIHVVGSSVRAFVEGFGTETKTTMVNNLSETLIGLGGQRATQLVDEIQVIPISPGAAGTDLSTRMLLLEASVDSILTSVPAAIASLKDEIGVQVVAEMDADPPSVNVTQVNGTATSLLSEPIDANVTEVLGSAPTLLSDPLEANLTAGAIESVAEAASTETASNISSLAAARVVIPINAIPLDTNRVASSRLILNKRSSFTYTLSDVGDLTGVTSILFTIKDNKELDADSASLVQVKVSIPAASGTDGIQYLGAAAAGAKRTSGSIAVQTYTEGSVSKKRIVIAIADDATAMIPVEGDGTFDIKIVTSSDSEILDEGKAVVREVTTWETSS